ncbi:MAG: hypothetical protein WED00_08445 [Aquisalimonadaceae bacterium]
MNPPKRRISLQHSPATPPAPPLRWVLGLTNSVSGGTWGIHIARMMVLAKARDRVPSPELLRSAKRATDVGKHAVQLLGRSERLCELAVLHPLMAAVVLNPTLTGLWPKPDGVLRPSEKQTIEVKRALALELLTAPVQPSRARLRELCEWVGAPWQLRQTSAAPLWALSRAAELLLRVPGLADGAPSPAPAAWVEAVAAAHYLFTYHGARFEMVGGTAPTSELLLWVGRNAGSFLAAAGARFRRLMRRVGVPGRPVPLPELGRKLEYIADSYHLPPGLRPNDPFHSELSWAALGSRARVWGWELDAMRELQRGGLLPPPRPAPGRAREAKPIPGLVLDYRAHPEARARWGWD